MNDTNAGALLGGFIAVFILGFVLVMLAINIFICWLVSGCYNRIPQPFRKMEPGMVWLLLIPCFPIVWNFFVFPKLADSYLAYFQSLGRTDVGDCGKSIGLAYSICVAASLIPYLGMLTGLASLVLLIIFLIKANELKNQIPGV